MQIILSLGIKGNCFYFNCINFNSIEYLPPTAMFKIILALPYNIFKVQTFFFGPISKSLYILMVARTVSNIVITLIFKRNLIHFCVCPWLQLVYSSIFSNSKKLIKGNCIKFCLKNEIQCPRTFEMLSVTFRESTVSRTQVQLWYNRFKESRENVNDDARSGRPSRSTNDFG